MKRLALLFLLLVPTSILAIENLKCSCDDTPATTESAATEPPAPGPEDSAPWFRPSGSDEASLRFRHGAPGQTEPMPHLVLVRKPADLAPPPSERPGIRVI